MSKQYTFAAGLCAAFISLGVSPALWAYNDVSFSGSVAFDHDNNVDGYVYDCPTSLTYTFLSDTVSLSQFAPSLGRLESVELIVESDIDVETHYWYDWDTAHASQWWYSDVTGSVNGLQATISQDHNNHTIGLGYHDHVFTIDHTAFGGTTSGLAGFIGTGTVDVLIVGDDMLCAWWNPYHHIDTDTYGTVTVTLVYSYTYLVEIDIKPGSYPNSINLGSNGVVPVAILSEADFDATTVDPATVSLSGAGIAVRGKDSRLMASEEDVNGDGLIDLVLKVETENLDPSAIHDGYAVLTGKTYDGMDIEGSDEMNIVPMQ